MDPLSVVASVTGILTELVAEGFAEPLACLSAVNLLADQAVRVALSRGWAHYHNLD